MKNKIIKKEHYKTSLWSGGKTTELYIYPEDAIYKNKNFLFRLSSATVELEQSNFTPLIGIKRFIAPIDGSLKLLHQGNEVYLEPFECYEFDGGIPTTSEGKVTDFNLMLSKDVSGTLESYYLEKSTKIEISKAKNDLCLIYAPDLSLSIISKKTYHLSSKDLGLFYKEPLLKITSNTAGYFFIAKIQLTNL